jgi:hypothetical protein
MSQPVSADTIRPRAAFPARMRLVLNSVILALLVINALILLTLDSDRTAMAPVNSAPEQVFYDDGGHMQITLTSAWVALPEKPNGSILFASDQASDRHLLVFRESKSDHVGVDPKYRTLDGYAAFRAGQLNEALGNGTQGKLVSLTISGLPGRQAELSGTAQGNSITILETIVEAPDAFYQIRLVTVSDRFAAARATFSKAAQSFLVRGL